MGANDPVQIVKSNTLTTTIAKTRAGSTLIVCINSYNTSSISITSVKLGTASLASAESASASVFGTTASYIYYLDNIAAGQTTVTIAASGLNVASGSGGVCIYEVPQLLTTGSLDVVHPGDATSGTTWSSGSSGTLGQAAEFVVGSAAGPAGGLSEPAGWVCANDSLTVWVTGYKIVAATTAQTFTGSQSSSNPWASVIASFKISPLGDDTSAFFM